jgi:peptidoglycan/xylan/chitin deacetylase (PgdA/CDA1 family)
MSDSLSAELAELKAAAAHNRARFRRLEGLRWPGAARIAVNITVDFDAMLLRRLNNEPPMELAKGEFGGRVGIWRLLELFADHDIKATIFTPGRICELYPEALRAAVRGGHELADHMWEHRVPKEPAVARDHLSKTAAALKAISGQRPVGSRSHYPAALLREEGFIYNSHGARSHRPYYVLDEGGQPLVLELPFHFAIDDAMFFSFAWYRSTNAGQRLADTDRVFELWLAAFQQQYRQAGYLNICLHPFVSGRALRIAMLDRLLAAMKTSPGVWFASCEEVARHCLAAYPAGALAAAAPAPGGA